MTAIQRRRRTHRLGVCLLARVATLGLFGGTAVAQIAPPPPPAPQLAPNGLQANTAIQINGIVESYNYSPSGNFESLMLKAGDKRSQVNFPPDVGGSIAAAARIGDQVSLSVLPVVGMPDHGVYELVSFTPPSGQPLTIPNPDDWRAQHIDGTVKGFNYGRQGEIDGVVLESGDFVHVGPDVARSFNFTVGQKLGIDGYARTMLNGHNLIEADTINGVRVQTTTMGQPVPPPPEGPGRVGRGRGGPGPGRGPAAPPPPAPGFGPLPR